MAGGMSSILATVSQPGLSRGLKVLVVGICLLVCVATLILCRPGTLRAKELGALPMRVVNYVQYKSNEYGLTSPRLKEIHFNAKKVVIYSNDFHIGPIQDLKDLLQPLGVSFIDQSLSGHCHLTKTCQRDIKVVSKGNGINLDPTLIPKFYEAYKNDAKMASVDAFVCFHPSSMCELFMPFNKSLIVIASTRYELGRFAANRWTSWNKHLIKIASDPKNVVAGNNMYDAKYIEFFTGVKAQVLTSYCGYIKDMYTGERAGYLLAPIHKRGFQKVFMDGYKKACGEKGRPVEITPLRTKYAHYKYSDLAAHKGIVYVPYQVSVMSLFEQYRMNIPLFFPSRRLLAAWQLQHMVMNERTWAGVSGQRATKSSIPPHPDTPTQVPDPNNDSNGTAIEYWIEYADFYRFPHITYYDSYSDLVDKLDAADLHGISGNMAQYNKNFRRELISQWSDILSTVSKHSSNHPH